MGKDFRQTELSSISMTLPSTGFGRSTKQFLCSFVSKCYHWGYPEVWLFFLLNKNVKCHLN